MKLTEKCKKDFEKWYFKHHVTTTKKFKDLYPHEYHEIYDWFYGIDLSFQYGVYVDFFDSVGIIIDIQPLLDYDDKQYTNIYSVYGNIIKLNFPQEENYNRNPFECKTRQEARTKAIEKADEIFNSLNK